jgi:hypothetical protein
VAEGSLALFMVASATEPERLVFVDEMGTNTSLAPLCMPGRAEANERFVRRRATGERTSRSWRA